MREDKYFEWVCSICITSLLIQKISKWLEDSKYRHRFLSRTNNIVAKRLLKKHPGWTSFLYVSMLWVVENLRFSYAKNLRFLSTPTTLNTWETVRNFGEMYGNARVPEDFEKVNKRS